MTLGSKGGQTFSSVGTTENNKIEHPFFFFLPEAMEVCACTPFSSFVSLVYALSNGSTWMFNSTITHPTVSAVRPCQADACGIC